MREKIKQDFRKLLEIIEQERPGFISILGKGLPDEEIQKYINIHLLPEGFIAIYSCIRGGVYFESLNDFNDSIDFIPTYYNDFIPGYYFIEIDKIEEVIKTWQDIYSKYLEECPWQPDMIPFLEDSAGDYYCVRTLPDNQSVVLLFKGEPGITIICQSIKDFLLIVAECYKQNAYFLDEDRYLNCNYDLEKKIILKFNPNYYSQNGLEPEV
ncbi:SMI1/KNR4 family protein [Chlorogloeopsis sp. ULAP01]|uniref:SMI1/KNR4 family protein n=1 Tax=Chlorogloeopsis sp. ULAP01 TaxID=3056483 RepID=UPI0025AB4B80|nr:SMI1/KNR4 family protein [Chlorogloeopsis sp. ULAP01]MDM9381773.1 SMI1/KNR4 family protein [Chlorogloeopsis sp. ULAP01]